MPWSMGDPLLDDIIAEQKEHERRSSSCVTPAGVRGGKHAYRPHGTGRAAWSQCIVCGVTETSEDWRKRQAAQKTTNDE